MKITGLTRYSLVVFWLVIFPLTLSAAENPEPMPAPAAHLEVLYMNHGPLRPTLRKIRHLVSTYGSRLQVTWYDFDTPAGKNFMNQHNLSGHIPLLLFLDGQSEFILEGRKVRLQGFPSGAGPFKSVEGNWTLPDLDTILKQRINPQDRG